MHGSENVNILNIASVNIDSTRYVGVYVDGMLSLCDQFSVVNDQVNVVNDEVNCKTAGVAG